MTFGHELRADDYIDLALLDLAQGVAKLATFGVRSLDRSTRRESGNNSATSSAMRSMPGPHATSEFSASQFGHFSGIGTNLPQW